MATCNGCGGIVGRDCFNPQECEWIANDQRRHYEDQHAQEIRDENLRLRELCGCAYQLAGYHDAPEAWLDVLSEAAQGMPISEWSVQGDLIEALLPYAPEPVEFNGISAHPGELVSMTWAQYAALRNAALSHAAGQEAVAWVEFDEAVELAAECVYDQWKSDPNFVPWTPGGNSDKQYLARDIAKAALCTVAVRRLTHATTTNPAEIGRKSVGAGQEVDEQQEMLATAMETEANLLVSIVGRSISASDVTLLRQGAAMIRKQACRITPAQPPASAEVGRDAVGATFYAACERACSELPPDWEIRVCLEKDSGTVELCSPDGFSEYMDVDADDRLTAELNAAIDAAIAAPSTQERRNESPIAGVTHGTDEGWGDE